MPHLLVLQQPTIRADNMIFLTPVKNNIMNGTFSRLLYSTPNFTTNGLCVKSTSSEIEALVLSGYHSKKQVHSYFSGTFKPSVLKISGVWETATEIGIAYKFIHSF